MAIIGMRDMCWGFGGPPLLENITLQIEKGERMPCRSQRRWKVYHAEAFQR